MRGKKAVKSSHEENNKAKDRPVIDEFQHPPSQQLVSRSGDLALDSYPQMVKKGVNNAFYNICDIVLPILEKDSVPLFLRYLKEDGRGVCWRGMITPETFNHMMIDGALKCAKTALEGWAPELNGHRANPNCINQYGYFPLHEAAESFNVLMIKLLLAHGALPSVRTAGAEVVEN
ncbi:hypothetical protein QOZ80_3AG0232110 [Eleusine coracana subsp. coracana]|nr:hypothetical protein QOZ80_3AG0232110 [Eleusine coracana subsp. coracana]